MNDKKVVHPSNSLTHNDHSNIEDHKIHLEQTNQNIKFCTCVDNTLQLSSNLQDSDKTNNWKTANSHEVEIVMA